MTIRLYSAVVAAVLMLSACGGGGDGGAGGGGGGGGGGTTGSLTLSVSTLTFTATSLNSPPPAQTVSATVTGNISGTLFIKVVVTGTAVGNVSNLTLTGGNSGQATVTPQSPSVLGTGTHTGTITVTACTSDINCSAGIIGSPQTINVTYTVSEAVTGPTTSPGALSFVLTDNSPDGDYVKTLQVSASPPWTLTTTLGALSIAPGNGSAANGMVTVTLNHTMANAMSSGVTNTSLTLTNSLGVQITVPVAIDIRRPQINYASPHVEAANTTGTTILRGVALDTTTITAVRFGSGGSAVPATSINVFGATEIRVGRPALPAGTYPVQVIGSSGTNISLASANVVVVDSLSPAVGGTIPYPDSRQRLVTSLVFDAERSALVLGVQYPATGETASEILRYSYSSGWSTATVRVTPYLSSMALRPDGSGWLATAMINSAADNTFVLCTPDIATCSNSMVSPANGQRWTGIGMTNDGDPIVLSTPKPNTTDASPVLRFNLQQNLLRGVNPPVTYDGLLAASDDGSAVIIGSRANFQPMYLFRVNSGTFSPIPVAPLVSSLVIDGRGSKAIVNRTLVFDPNTMVQITSLPASTLAVVMSRDGSRAHAYANDGKVHTYDLTQFPPVDMNGGIVVADPGTGPSDVNTRMAISPDGRTLFLAGSTQIVVVPLP